MNSHRRGIRSFATITPLAVALIAFGVLSSTPALAQDAPADSPAAGQAASGGAPIKGTFVLDTEASDDIDQVMEEGTKEMGLTTSIARGRLKDTNPVYRTIEIDATADSVKLTFDQSTTLVTAATGEEIAWRYKGERFKVCTRWESSAVVQTFAAFDGTRENVTSLDPDGVTLRVVTTVTSGMLPGPVKYVLVYRRKDS